MILRSHSGKANAMANALSRKALESTDRRIMGKQGIVYLKLNNLVVHLLETPDQRVVAQNEAKSSFVEVKEKQHVNPIFSSAKKGTYHKVR